MRATEAGTSMTWSQSGPLYVISLRVSKSSSLLFISGVSRFISRASSNFLSKGLLSERCSTITLTPGGSPRVWRVLWRGRAVSPIYLSYYLYFNLHILLSCGAEMVRKGSSTYVVTYYIRL
ncbi:hypothetical protein Y032_0379g326 [Ancylostoma ceylanicum]|uniref:Uncharacterized protein n=1 Tax=Ancylostoma ceylanicum TaxID=53326 RepID=A0A016RU27_9BILA|nr:hypothetical protein Y032_0379g326 [Ancylostoma ceylanicum]